jgi:Pyridoxamine 5'-phosphate oxidase
MSCRGAPSRRVNVRNNPLQSEPGRELGSRIVANEDVARAILDAGSYVVLATADADGVPWASPVWYAMEEYPEL